jgi:hypothetical protein
MQEHSKNMNSPFHEVLSNIEPLYYLPKTGDSTSSLAEEPSYSYTRYLIDTELKVDQFDNINIRLGQNANGKALVLPLEEALTGISISGHVGSGKSQFVCNLITEWSKFGSVLVVDPKWSLYQKTASYFTRTHYFSLNGGNNYLKNGVVDLSNNGLENINVQVPMPAISDLLRKGTAIYLTFSSWCPTPSEFVFETLLTAIWENILVRTQQESNGQITPILIVLDDMICYPVPTSFIKNLLALGRVLKAGVCFSYQPTYYIEQSYGLTNAWTMFGSIHTKVFTHLPAKHHIASAVIGSLPPILLQYKQFS